MVSLLGSPLKELEGSQATLGCKFHCSTIHNGPKVETSQVSIKGQTDERTRHSHTLDYCSASKQTESRRGHDGTWELLSETLRHRGHVRRSPCWRSREGQGRKADAARQARGGRGDRRRTGTDSDLQGTCPFGATKRLGNGGWWLLVVSVTDATKLALKMTMMLSHRSHHSDDDDEKPNQSRPSGPKTPPPQSPAWSRSWQAPPAAPALPPVLAPRA